MAGTLAEQKLTPRSEKEIAMDRGLYGDFVEIATHADAIAALESGGMASDAELDAAAWKVVERVAPQARKLVDDNWPHIEHLAKVF